MTMIPPPNLQFKALRPPVNTKSHTGIPLQDVPAMFPPAMVDTTSLWESGLKADTLKFSGTDRKLPANSRAHDNYGRYTPKNTHSPPAVYHMLYSKRILDYHRKNLEVLEKYIQGTGEYPLDVAWVKNGKRLGEAPYVVFDTETTGNQKDDRIIQLALTEVEEDHDVRYLAGYNQYINPGKNADGSMFPINPGAIEVHGITPEMVKDMPTIEEVLMDVRKNRLRENGIAVAYNAQFDIGKMNAAIDRWNRSSFKKEHGRLKPMEHALTLDAYVLIQRIHPFMAQRRRLGETYQILMGQELTNKHDAQADAIATVDVLKYTFKYLQKHTIPKDWAEAVNNALPKEGLTPEDRYSLITRIVRENRAALAKKYPVKTPAVPLKFTDVLKFQHGGMVTDEETGFPKLDIALTALGWDGQKVWSRGDDSMDHAVAKEIRQERDSDNRKFLDATFTREFVHPSMTELVGALKAVITNANKPKKPIKDEVLREAVLDPLSQDFVERFMTGTLPDSDKAWDKYQRSLKEQLVSSVKAQLKAYDCKPALSTQLEKRVTVLAGHLVTNAKQVQDKLGSRYFYRFVPVDPKKPLIDPTVLKITGKLSSKASTQTPSPGPFVPGDPGAANPFKTEAAADSGPASAPKAKTKTKPASKKPAIKPTPKADSKTQPKRKPKS